MVNFMNGVPMKEDGLGQFMSGSIMAHMVKPSGIDKLGYWPGVGQVVALGRAVYGTVKLIVSVVMLIFSEIFYNRSYGWNRSAVDGLKHLGRAVVEAVPVAGGLCTYIYDKKRMEKAFRQGALLY